MPLYCLSFTEGFFTGDEPLDDVRPSDRPTSVYQAALNMPRADRVDVSREVFGYDPGTAERHADSDGFAMDVVDRVRETDLCDGFSSPVRVYLNSDQDYWLDIHED